jgi:glutaredoxin
MIREAVMKALLWVLVLLAAGAVQAQSTYRWVDQDGKVHYGDRPPPPKAARDVKERKYAVPEAGKAMSHAMRQAVENFPVTLYVTADCTTACKEGRDYLNRRGIPFTEQAVASNEEIVALRDRLGGGDVMVPVLQVGDKSSKGFLATAWSGLLDAAGYPAAPAR